MLEVNRPSTLDVPREGVTIVSGRLATGDADRLWERRRPAGGPD